MSLNKQKQARATTNQPEAKVKQPDAEIRLTIKYAKPPDARQPLKKLSGSSANQPRTKNDPAGGQHKPAHGRSKPAQEH